LRVVRNAGPRLSLSIRRPASETSSQTALRWFWIVFAVTTVFQVTRLMQDSPALWLAMDYAMRIAALALLALSPVRAAVFRREARRVTVLQLVICTLVTGAAVFMAVLVERRLMGMLPDLSIGHYPRLRGWLYLFDLTFGLVLVAVHEELVFRRLARAAFSRLGDGLAMMATTSVLFGLYHWWTGPLNVLMAATAGMVLMLLYRAVGALWPAILVHYCVDLYVFA
jgi:membrane protease YdiL (CAAX protease family)